MSAASNRGFTLVELVLTITLIAILSAYAAPRFFNRVTFAERGYYEDLLAAARYGQKLAIGSGCHVRLTVTAGSYTLARKATFCDSGGYTATVMRPDGSGVFTNTVPDGVSSSVATLVFNPDGSATPSTNTTVTVGTFQFVVVGSTGFVQTP